MLSALERGPASTGDLVTRVKAAAPTLRRTLQELVRCEKVHQEGTGPRNFRWLLGPKIAKPKPPTKLGSDEVGEVVWNGATRNVSLGSR